MAGGDAAGAEGVAGAVEVAVAAAGAVTVAGAAVSESVVLAGSVCRINSVDRITTTTRRLALRPSAVSLPLSGRCSPYPMTASRSGPTPWLASTRTTLPARAADSSQ